MISVFLFVFCVMFCGLNVVVLEPGQVSTGCSSLVLEAEQVGLGVDLPVELDHGTGGAATKCAAVSRQGALGSISRMCSWWVIRLEVV